MAGLAPGRNELLSTANERRPDVVAEVRQGLFAHELEHGPQVVGGVIVLQCLQGVGEPNALRPRLHADEAHLMGRVDLVQHRFDLARVELEGGGEGPRRRPTDGVFLMEQIGDQRHAVGVGHHQLRHVRQVPGLLDHTLGLGVVLQDPQHQLELLMLGRIHLGLRNGLQTGLLALPLFPLRVLGHTHEEGVLPERAQGGLLNHGVAIVQSLEQRPNVTIRQVHGDAVQCLDCAPVEGGHCLKDMDQHLQDLLPVLQIDQPTMVVEQVQGQLLGDR
mmetsp:Transcript_90332/g.156447  ORF Transcript_90332/g.156447 Transcript_90332/m.156447 type:complete len:275 (-) Transcript_90332:462-1286(-)